MKSCCLTCLLFAWMLMPCAGTAQVEVARIDGKSTLVDSVTIESGMVVTPESKVDVNEIRLLDFQKEIKPAGGAATVGLIGGGSLGATAVKLQDDAFVIENVAGQISLGVDAVTQIKFKNEDLPLFQKATPKEDLDQLFVKIEGNYQTVPGIVDTIDDAKVSFIYDEDAIEFKLEDVYGLILAQGAGKAKPEVNGVVAMTEGSRLNCLITAVSSTDIKATIGVAEVVVPRDVVSRIEIRSNRLAFLSDLEPASVEYDSGSIFVRKWQKDLNVSGGPLVLRDRDKRISRTFGKGLGTKSGMKMVFDNAGFDRFVATIGMDASTNGHGLCRVRVVGEGKELFTSEVSGVDPPKSIDLEISGIDQVELIVEFGNDFLDLSDHLNWCDARFVKKSD